MFDFDNTPQRRGTNSMKWDVGENELPMWIADMDFATAPAITKALLARAEHGCYGYAIVPDAWYNTFISWWKRRHDFEMKPEWLQFCTGVVPAISSIVKRVTNHGDQVALLTPNFNVFYNSIENAGRTVAECRLVYENGKFHIDFEALEKVLAHPLTTMFIFCNPHNPTGNIWSKEEIVKISELCKKHGVLVLSDEIHCDITEPGYKYVPYASVSEECKMGSITCISASKAFNMAGLQAAAVCIPNLHLREKIVRGLNSDEVAEPNCFAVEATVAAFNEGEEWLNALMAYLFENRKYTEEYLKKHLPKVHVTPANATYVLWIDCGAFAKDTDDLCEFLREKTGLVLTSGMHYRGDSKTFVRMNVACSRSRLQDGLERFVKGLKEYLKCEK